MAPFDVILSGEDVVQPDVLFVAVEHAGRISEVGVKGAPDLVVEVTSEGSRRLGELSAEGGDVLATRLLPGLEIPLAALFAR